MTADHRHPRSQVPTLTLGTWNLLHGRSLQDGGVRADDLRDAAATLDADVLALQEVDRGQPRSGGTDQTAVVAAALDARWHRFVPALWGEPGGAWEQARDGERVSPVNAEREEAPRQRPAYGIGLVSRWPVLDWDVLGFSPARVGLPLLVPGRGLVKVDDEPRVAVAALVDGPAGPITVVATHLSFVPGVNIRQLRSLVRWAQGWPAPRVLLGDLNLPGRLPALTTGWQQLVRTPTYPSWRPRVQFDHVLGHPDGAGMVEGFSSARAPVSDHNPVTVTLAWPPPAADG